MAFDGISVSALTKEINDKITDGRISKIAQPESDELLLTIKSPSGAYRLLISANPSLPLVYFTDENKQSPITAPSFCMLLRKHVLNGKIIKVYQPSLERIINIEIEHFDEMGDIKTKTLVIELMGKYSNIIFLDENNTVIDSIKRISSSVSSLREVLPGREYFIPDSLNKANPLAENREHFIEAIKAVKMPLSKALYSLYTGLSPFFATNLLLQCDIDENVDTQSDFDIDALYYCFKEKMDCILNGEFVYSLYYENAVPYEYSALPLTGFTKEQTVLYESMSKLLSDYYSEKELQSRIRQKSVDLRKIVSTIIERDSKKLDIYEKQLKDTLSMEKFKVYGELINTYGYSIPDGSKSLTCQNYYTGEDITIPLNSEIPVLDNAKRYFEKYGKLKRTKEAVNSLKEEVSAELEHLYSISNSLDIAKSDSDLSQIKEELVLSGYVKKKNDSKKKNTNMAKSLPLHYVTKDGFHIYVGKNNLQNEYITFKLANGNDWWFHAKKIPGSHVIVKTEGKALPDTVYEDAARLAAFYSKAKGNSRIEVDYVQRKEVKHPNGSKPGFVVYYTNYSMLIDSDISHLELVEG